MSHADAERRHPRRRYSAVEVEGRQVGNVVEATLALEQMPLAELMEAARQLGIADLSSVRLAVLEPSGKISFIEEP